MSRLALYLLGPPRLELDGEPVHIGRRKAVALLAYLAVTGRNYSRDSLAALLWPEYDQSRARADLRRTLSVLNRTLGSEWLTADGETAGLNPDAGLWLDVDQFRSLLSVWQDHGHPEADICSECLGALAEAVELYQGDFLAGFTLRDSAPFDEWQFFQTEGLKDQLASALVRLASYHTSQGEYELAIEYARRWLALDLLHEPAHRHLMALYAHVGQQSAALRQYQLCEQTLLEELGLPPSEETKALYEQIRTQPADRAEPITPIPRARHNLPVQSTPFVAREAVLAEIKGRLDDPACRLLTLVGAGGSGKTRLALEAAAAQLDNYPHGVYFVSLAPLESSEAILPAVAQALGFSFYEGGTPPQQQLLDYLRPKGMLLILDNFEHLLEGVDLVSDVLQAAPGVKILATSRARLNVGGEHRFRIAGMDYPHEETTRTRPETFAQQREDVAQYSAVKLFLQGARRAQPSFELTDENLSGVVQVCRLVDGLPLGIRLAAAWVGMLTPAEIAIEIERSLDFLETERRGVPARQRSVRAAFDRSYHLLSEREREVFQQLSVFRGGFTREAAQEVTGVSLQVLMALVDKSLLDRTPTPSTPHTTGLSTGSIPSRTEGLRTGRRYELHELLRQYAAEKLNKSPAAGEAARDRHCAYYATFLQQREADLKGARQQMALVEIEADGENARVAWNWAVERGQIRRLAQAMDGLCQFYEWRGRYQDGEAACRAVAEKLMVTASGEGSVLSPSTMLRTSADGTSVAQGLRVLAKVLAWHSFFSFGLGRGEPGLQLLQQSLAILEGRELADQDTRPERAFGLQVMASLYWDFFSREERAQFCEESLLLYQALGDRWGTATVMSLLGWRAHDYGAYGEAKRLHEQCLAIRQALGDQRGIAESLLNMGRTSWVQGQLEEAERFLRESLALLQEIDDRSGIPRGLFRLGEALVRLGRFVEGCSLMEEGLAMWDDQGHHSAWTERIPLLGEAETHLGRYEPARDHGQAILCHFREAVSAWSIGFSQFVLGLVALAEEAYAEAQQLLQESVAAFQDTSCPDNMGWALAVLGYTARGLGQPSQAGQYLAEALQVFTEIGAFFPLMYGLPAVAVILADRGEIERAVELYALASRYTFVANSRWFEDVAGSHIAAVATTLPPEVVVAAQERGRARDLDTTVAELLAELGE